MSSATKTIIIAAALLVAGLAGIGLTADDADAVGDYVTEYKIGDRTVVESSETATVTLKTLEDLGTSAPAGKTFKAWQIDAAQYAAGSTYIFGETGTKTVTAVWEEITYTATFVIEGVSTLVTGTLAEEKDLAELAPADPSAEGKIFVGWLAEGADAPVDKADLGTLAEDVTYTAVFTTDWTVTFVDGDVTYTSKASAPVAPVLGERAGFTFLGWFLGTEQVDVADFDYTADVTFTAKWEPVILTVTFVAGDEVLAVQPVQYGQRVNQPVVDFPAGFEGWDFDFNTIIKADTTVEALVAEPVYKVVFVIEGNRTVTDSEVMQVPEASKIGNEFVGWAVDGQIVDLDIYEIAADTTFTAVFKPYTYTVTFMDGDKVLFTQTVEYGKTATLPATSYTKWQTRTVTVIPADPEVEGSVPTEQVTYADYAFSIPVTDDVVLYGVAPVDSPGFFETPTGKCAAILIVFAIGLLAFAIYTGKLPILKKGGKKE